MNKISEERLNKVHPALAEAARVIAEEVKIKTGHELQVTQGLRTIEEQNALYAKGRTTAGPKVTNARGGESMHNYGLAVDFCLANAVFDKNGKKTHFPEYDISTGTGERPVKWVEHPVWRAIRDAAKRLGLDSGYDWKFKDKPHVELKGPKAARGGGEAGRLYKLGGMKLVWESASLKIKTDNTK